MPGSDRSRAPTVAVLHLARRANGEGPVRDFLRAYAARSAGAAHELILLGKGHDDERELRAVGADAGVAVARVIPMSDEGYDLTAYLRSAGLVEHEVLVFLNSFSAPLVDGWLGRLASAVARPGVGMAGATGSWASMVAYLRYQLGLPSPYASAFRDRGRVRAALAALDEAGVLQARGALREWAGTAVALAQHSFAFPWGFPAPHLRTNAFAVGREVMLEMRGASLSSKRRAHALESGRGSFTRQVQSLGLEVVVAGADGDVFGADRWPDSATFWQRGQENLLVADNQTRVYAHGDTTRRGVLSRYAWAERAQPVAAA